MAARRNRARRRSVRRPQRGDEARFSPAARRSAARRLRAIMSPSAKPLGDVGAAPPAGERRQIVGRDAGDRERGVFGGRQNSAPRRSNHSTRVPRIRRAVSFSRKPCGTVPRSSPTTMHRGALALERDMAEQIVERDRRDRRPRPACAPSGMTNSRARPIAWSMRSTPAWRMLAAISVEKPRQPSRAPASGLGGGTFQICPCAENGSGGAPTLSAERKFRARAPSPPRRRAPRRPRDRDRSRCRGRSLRPAPPRRRAGGRRAIGRRGRRRRRRHCSPATWSSAPRFAVAQRRRASVANPRPPRSRAIASKMAKRRSASPPAATKRSYRRRSDRPAARARARAKAA